jgi:hypothetical protein
MVVIGASPAAGQVYRVKVLTDASPDYHDLDSMVRSITSRWDMPEEKCWALFYWNHLGRRQTAPMEVHGLAVTDPIRRPATTAIATTSAATASGPSIPR